MGGDGVLDRSSHSAKLATRKAGSGSLGSRSHSRAVAPAAHTWIGRVSDFTGGAASAGAVLFPQGHSSLLAGDWSYGRAGLFGMKPHPETSV